MQTMGARGGGLAFLPYPYADETMGNVVSRYAMRAGQTSCGTALDALSGSDGCRPSGSALNWFRVFARTARDSLGVDMRAYLNATTLLPFYGAFWSASEREAATAWLCDEADGAIPTRLHDIDSFALVLGIPRHRSPFCPACCARDLAERGEYYWHRSLQLPLVRCCPVCGTPTVAISIQYGGSLQSIFTADQIGNTSVGRRTDVALPKSQYQLAVWCERLLSGEVGPYVPRRLAHLYREILQDCCPFLSVTASASQETANWEGYVLTRLWREVEPNLCREMTQSMRFFS
jgi:hypothetical protein